MKKSDIKQIAQAVLLERLSPANYARIANEIQHKIVPQEWECQSIVANFGLPCSTGRIASKQYNSIRKIIKTRIALDKEIQKINRMLPQGYRPYEAEQDYNDDEEYDDEYDD